MWAGIRVTIMHNVLFMCMKLSKPIVKGKFGSYKHAKRKTKDRNKER